MAGIYTYVKALTNPSTTNPAIQIKAGATYVYNIVRIRVTQSGSTTSTAAEIALKRMSAAATVSTGASGDWGKSSSRDQAIALSFGTSATGFTGSSTGTATDVIFDEGWNWLNGFEFFPTPEMQSDLAAGEIMALFTPVCPAGTYVFEIVMQEMP